jgi:hypothetical protein
VTRFSGKKMIVNSSLSSQNRVFMMIFEQFFRFQKYKLRRISIISCSLGNTFLIQISHIPKFGSVLEILILKGTKPKNKKMKGVFVSVLEDKKKTYSACIKVTI